MKSLLPALFTLLATTSAPAQPSTRTAVEPPVVRVHLETSAGSVTLALDYRRAPQTVAAFLRYVDDGRLDGTEFYRASRSKLNTDQGFIQGGIGTNPRRKLPATPFEGTDRTGLTHVHGAVSMARGDSVDIATCNFTLLVGPLPWLDARPGSPGYAVFGKVADGMPVVKRILAQPTGGGVGAMRGQMLYQPVKIIRAVRLNGTAKPTGRPKAWLIALPQRKVLPLQR
ncbi:peptidylprolyl isomerase [Sphingobium sufflavum]|uniref:peptidylprolyl isomerase n=1 Tax=Sphingobium sufflavum TaxID=1129547 RepID=UPI001F160E89|nr:peptidylprolyl isomerase [Sphingobium sufflavum]MCE7797060.1 peptidylprolyl isomerase [Sphingobium sufflavum]